MFIALNFFKEKQKGIGKTAWQLLVFLTMQFACKKKNRNREYNYLLDKT
jgi:hypothetical protein